MGFEQIYDEEDSTGERRDVLSGKFDTLGGGDNYSHTDRVHTAPVLTGLVVEKGLLSYLVGSGVATSTFLPARAWGKYGLL